MGPNRTLALTSSQKSEWVHSLGQTPTGDPGDSVADKTAGTPPLARPKSLRAVRGCGHPTPP
eukprot:873234-Lingulodinium_polyedra.AAC.1